MKKNISLPALVIISFIVSACTISLPDEHGMNMEHGDTMKNRNLSIHDLSTATALAFRIDEDGQAFAKYGVSHTKEMHLIIIRSDLTQFSHLHPLRNTDGAWSIPFQLKEPGTYWLFADFVDAEHAPFTLRFDRKIGGDVHTSPIVHDPKTTKIIDGYNIAMTSKETEDAVTFTYKISDTQGNAVMPEEYLGAKGHSVFLSPNADFVHAHPPEDATDLHFRIARPKDDFYRSFTQFQVNGKILTVDFDWENKK